MKTFTDTTGRAWTVTVNVDAIKRVRDALGVNLAKVVDDNFKLLAEVVEDPIRLVDVLYVLCCEQADAQKISDVDFGRAMSGDSLMMAADAFIEAITDFFPNARARAMLQALLGKGRKVRDLLAERAEAQIEAIDPDREASMLIASFGNSPAQSASIPAP